MKVLTKLTQPLIILIAIIHAGLAIGEIFFGVPFLVSRLKFPPEIAIQANPIVQNAGIYNSFIAAGLFWSAFSLKKSKKLSVFFLICVIIAGIFGSITLRPTTLILQTLPALLALILVFVYNPQSTELQK